MTKLTRDEIKRACEAAAGIGHEGLDSDPIAFLEAWRMNDPEYRSWSIESPLPQDGVLADDEVRVCVNDDLDPNASSSADDASVREAAVRAVLAWSEAGGGDG